MKFARNNDKHKVRANVEMTPIIDVVFQLLIFFMLTSTFVVQSSIPVEVSEASGASTHEPSNMEITLSNDPGGPEQEGRIVVNIQDDVEISQWKELISVLTLFHEEQPEGVVLIRPDKNIPTGRLVKVLGYVHNAGITQYGIAAEAPDSEE